MQELGWATRSDVARARRSPIRARPRAPRVRPARQFVAWAASIAEGEESRRLAKGRGLVVETSLDPHLQEIAERAVQRGLNALHHPGGPQAALVCLDAETGDVLAHVGGDPSAPSAFDRANQAQRQPRSTVKPFILLEAFQTCGSQRALNPASRVADEPLHSNLRSGPWSPVNADGRFRGVIDLRHALRASLNVPMVRVARHCGFEDTAARFRDAGRDVPVPPPPSFTLGALETTPLRLAEAYTALAGQGVRLEARPLQRIETPSGRRLEKFSPDKRRVSGAAAAFLVNELLRDVVRSGTARSAAMKGLEPAAKTGTSSELKDAWIAGHLDGLVTVVWVGLDDGRPPGLAGSQAAAPIWKDFMEQAVPSRHPRKLPEPGNIIRYTIDPDTGLRVKSRARGAREEVFRRWSIPPKDRFPWPDDPVPVIR